jgi:WD40 repeat protein
MVGFGLLAGPGMVVTCAHVVAQSLGKDPWLTAPPGGQPVLLDFPAIPGAGVHTARVAVWRPLEANGAGDIAGLLIDGGTDGLPAALRHLPLARGGRPTDHDFLAYQARPGEAPAWVPGKIVGKNHLGPIQLGQGTDASGLRLLPGSSGSPVWDQHAGQVVGLVSQVSLRKDTWHGLAVYASDIYQAWPELREFAEQASPFRGLAPFGPADGDVFFGRSEVAAAVTEAIVGGEITVLAGASGAGKTSLLRASVQRRLTDLGFGVVYLARPGASLWDSLAAALLGSELAPDRDESDLARALAAGPPERTLERIGRYLGARRLVIVVDQFDDILQPGGQPSARVGAARIADELLALAGPRSPDGGPSARVVLVVREDLTAAVRGLPGYERAVGEPLLVRTLPDDQLREAITEPVRLLGGSFEDDRLIDRIIDDTRSQHSLSMVQVVLTSLWQRRQPDGALTHTAYQAIGADPIAALADSAWATTTNTDKAAARALFLHLVAPLEDGRLVRRPAAGGELDTRLWAVAGALATQANRLVVIRTGPGGTAIAELAHDALIEHWPQLAALLASEHDLLTWRDGLRRRHLDWEQSGRRPGQLPAGSLLSQGVSLSSERPGELTRRELDFIAAGRRHRRARRLGLAFAAAAVVVAMAASLLAAIALRADHAQAGKAERATRQRAAEQLLRLANGQRAADPLTALRLNLAAQAITPSPDSRAALTTAIALPGFSRALPGHDLASIGLDDSFGWLPGITAMAASADGRLFVTADMSNTVFIWDVADPLHPRRLAYLGGRPGAACTCPGSMIALSPDGRTLAVAWQPVTTSVTFWDLTDPSHPRLVSHNEIPSEPVSGVTSFAFSPGGDLFALSAQGVGTFLWNVADPAHPRLDGPPGKPGRPWPEVAGLARIAPGRPFTTSTASALTVWDTSSPPSSGVPRRLTRIPGSWDAWLSPNGRLLAVRGPDHLARVYELSVPSAPRLLGVVGGGGHGGVGDLAFSPNGARVAVGNEDGSVGLWDVRAASTPRLLWIAGGHPADVTAVTFLAGGHTFVTGADDGTVLLWDVAGQSMATHLVKGMNPDAGSAPVAVFAPHEPLLAVGGSGRRVRLWDLGDPAHPRRLGSTGGLGAPVTSLAFSPDGKILAVGAADGTVHLWAVRALPGGKSLVGPPAVLRPYRTQVTSVAFSSDGRLLATAADHDPSFRNPATFPPIHATGGLVTLWRTGQPGSHVPLPRKAATIRIQFAGVESVAFQPDRPRLVVGGDTHSGYLYDVSVPAAPQQLYGNFMDVGSGRAAVAFSANGQVLVYGAGDTVTLDDAAAQGDSLVVSTLPTGLANITSVALANGVAAAGLDNGATAFYGLADLGSPAPLFTLPGYGSAVRAVSFGPGGVVVISYANGRLDLWDVRHAAAAVADPVAAGCLMAGRGLTQNEWARYVTGVPFQQTCGRWAPP